MTYYLNLALPLTHTHTHSHTNTYTHALTHTPLQRSVRNIEAMVFVVIFKAIVMETGRFMWTETRLSGDHLD